jgi:hypothetical protein
VITLGDNNINKIITISNHPTHAKYCCIDSYGFHLNHLYVQHDSTLSRVLLKVQNGNELDYTNLITGKLVSFANNLPVRDV